MGKHYKRIDKQIQKSFHKNLKREMKDRLHQARMTIPPSLKHEALSTWTVEKVLDWLQPVDPVEFRAQHQRPSRTRKEDAFEVLVDVRGFEKEEITVKASNRYLEIEGKKVDPDTQMVLKELFFKYLIPSDIDPDSIRSFLKNDNFLLLKGQIKDEEQDIPIPIVID